MALVRIEVQPSVLDWAIERSGRDESAYSSFALDKWRSGDRPPTVNQLERFASATRTPFGLLLLDEPPELDLPLTDFRTRRDAALGAPSADLLEAIHTVQRRQAWWRDHLLEQGHQPLDFVGSMSVGDQVVSVAAEVRQRLPWEADAGRRVGDWTATRTALAERIENIGVLVMIAGYLGGNTKRTLDPDEFRGFTIADNIAPVVFVNGRDTRAGQLFTLVHELAHVWLGRSGVDRPEPGDEAAGAIERWCNEVAAEVLVPQDHLRGMFDPDAPMELELSRLANHYRASGLVILSQLHSTGHLSWDEYIEARDEERSRALRALAERRDEASDGGNWYLNAPVMVSRRFLRAVLADAVAGGTPPTEAMRLVGSRSRKSLDGLVERYGP